MSVTTGSNPAYGVCTEYTKSASRPTTKWIPGVSMAHEPKHHGFTIAHSVVDDYYELY